MCFPTCAVVSDPDLYGLGIRLGVYSQLIASLLSNHLLPTEIGGAWDANFIFLVALLLATLKSLGTPQGLALAEVFILIQMMLAYTLSVFRADRSLWLLLTQYRPINLIKARRGEKVSLVPSELIRAYMNTSKLGIAARRVLRMAIAALNTWYWFSDVSRQTEDRDSCTTSVFLFARVNANGPAKAAFQLFAILHLVSTLLHWTFQTLPSTLRSLLRRGGLTRSTTIRLVRNSRWQSLLKYMIPQIKSYETAPLHDRRKDIISKWSLLGHFPLAILSTFTIIYSILAIELTLKWNGMSGINNVSSVGQFIPLTIGLSGLARVLALIAINHLRKSLKSERQSAVQPSTAVWRYWLSPTSYATFAAKVPQRRHSCDAKDGTVDFNPKTAFTTLVDVADPIAPTPPSWYTPEYGPKPKRVYFDIQWWTARFQYDTPAGHRHVFHAFNIKRRHSISQGAIIRIPSGLCPHRARRALDVSIKHKASFEEEEQKRIHWWYWERARLHRLTQAQKIRLSHDPKQEIVRGNDYFVQGDGPGNHLEQLQGWRWLPQDVSSESLFVPREAPRPRRPGKIRRWSFDEADEARFKHGDYRRGHHEPPFLQTPRRYSHSSSSTASCTDSQADDRDDGNTRPRLKIRILFLLFRLLSAILCCSPCVALGFHYRRKWQHQHYKRKNHDSEGAQPQERSQLQPQSQTPLPRHILARRYACPQCDAVHHPNIKLTRQWHHEPPPTLSIPRHRQPAIHIPQDPAPLSLYLRWSLNIDFGIRASRYIGRKISPWLRRLVQWSTIGRMAYGVQEGIIMKLGAAFQEKRAERDEDRDRRGRPGRGRRRRAGSRYRGEEIIIADSGDMV